MKINKRIAAIYSASTFLRCFVFVTFFFLSIRSVFVYLNYLPGTLQIAGIIAILLFVAVCWWKIIWILYLFVAFIPLISGVQGLGFLKFAPLLSFAFSIIYTAWFLKRFFWDRKGFVSQNKISNIIDVLSGIVCLSIIVCLCEYPLNFLVYRLKYASIVGQEDPFWFMETGYRILQGFFLYRIFDLEINNKSDRKYFIPCLYFHAVTVIVFAFGQLIFNMPDQKGLGSIFSPFQDIHSYGGYVLILFFFVTYPALMKKDYTKKKILLVLSLLFCILISGSTATLVWLLAVGGVLSLIIYRKKRINIILVSILLFIIVGINLFPSVVPKGGHTAIQRYAIRLNYSTAFGRLGGRISSGDQALGIMKEFPFTGSGVGSFYKISRYYHFSDKAHPKRVENAHNYYLQFAAELGIPALVLFFMILFLTYRIGFHPSKKGYMKGLLFGLSAYLLTLITGHHLILSNQQFLFWFILFVISSSPNFYSVDSDEYKKQTVSVQSKYLSVILFIMIFLVFAGHALNLFWFQKKVLGSYGYGFYNEYQEIGGDRMRWTMKNSFIKVLAITDDFGFSIYTEPEKFSSNTLKVKIFANDNLIDQLTWEKEGFKHRYYHIPGIKGKYLEIRTSANDSFNPYKSSLSNNIKENRDQSAAITDIFFFRIPISKGLKKCVLE